MTMTDKNFRLSKQAKTRIALMKGTVAEKHALRHMLIDAQASEESAKRAALKSKDHKEGNRGESRGAVAPE